MIRSFQHKGLQRFFEKCSRSGVQAKHERRLRLMLSRLDDATKAGDMDAPGWKLHALKGNLKGYRAVWVDETWRLTFTFDGTDATLLNLQDYH
ncbi:MAG: type II toxin-antitoxin system RelE/ParE family toxin [Betaproteobacteria bacterium]